MAHGGQKESGWWLLRQDVYDRLVEAVGGVEAIAEQPSLTVARVFPDLFDRPRLKITDFLQVLDTLGVDDDRADVALQVEGELSDKFDDWAEYYTSILRGINTKPRGEENIRRWEMFSRKVSEAGGDIEAVKGDFFDRRGAFDETKPRMIAMSDLDIPEAVKTALEAVRSSDPDMASLIHRPLNCDKPIKVLKACTAAQAKRAVLGPIKHFIVEYVLHFAATEIAKEDESQFVADLKSALCPIKQSRMPDDSSVEEEEVRAAGGGGEGEAAADESWIECLPPEIQDQVRAEEARAEAIVGSLKAYQDKALIALFPKSEGVVAWGAPDDLVYALFGVFALNHDGTELREGNAKAVMAFMQRYRFEKAPPLTSLLSVFFGQAPETPESAYLRHLG